MEQPKSMPSEITETDSETIISTPKKKSWALIILLSVITLQFSNGIVQALFFPQDLPVAGRVVILLFSLAIIYLTLKVLLWQLKGMKEIRISKGELKLSKLSPLWSKAKTYRLADIKSIDVKDESVSEGPFAMLQILRITDRIKITFSYGYETITATSGIDMTEAIEIKNKMKNKMNLN